MVPMYALFIPNGKELRVCEKECSEWQHRNEINNINLVFVLTYKYFSLIQLEELTCHNQKTQQNLFLL